MMVLNLSIPEFAMLLLMTQLNLSSWQARDAFWQKPTLKMLLGSYQLVQTITICLGCSGGAYMISEFLGRKKVTLKEVQSLGGLLNFACSVIKPGRAFLRRLIDLTVGIRSPHHLIRLNKEVKEDLKV